LTAAATAARNRTHLFKPCEFKTGNLERPHLLTHFYRPSQASASPAQVDSDIGQ